jgi:Carboxypeptidase regulatory-like domain
MVYINLYAPKMGFAPLPVDEGFGGDRRGAASVQWLAMKRSLRGLVGMVLLLAVGALGGGMAQDDVPTSWLKFLVLRDHNGKPVKNAAVIMHPVNAKGKQAKGGMELKTDTEGRTAFDGIPYGMLRVQVLAPGFQTYGEDYDVNKPEMEITIKLKRPQGQYSIYDQPGEKKDDKKPPESKPQ